MLNLNKFMMHKTTNTKARNVGHMACVIRGRVNCEIFAQKYSKIE